MMFKISYNGKTNDELGIAVTTRPSIPAPVLRGDFVQIAGKNGSTLISDGTYENIEIPVEMNFVRNPGRVMESYRAAKSWLSGSGKLILSDDPDMYYRVKAVGISDIERSAKHGMKFMATFICDPFNYFWGGLAELDLPSVLENPWMEARPVYKITGEGNCTLTVNGNTMRANVGQNLTIDTDKMIAYREDGSLQNTAVTGNYDELVLVPGENTLAATSGFNVKIIPNWRTL